MKVSICKTIKRRKIGGRKVNNKVYNVYAFVITITEKEAELLGVYEQLLKAVNEGKKVKVTIELDDNS